MKQLKILVLLLCWAAIGVGELRGAEADAKFTGRR